MATASKSLALVLTLAALMPNLRAKPPADVQKKLDEFVAGSHAGAALAWVDRDGTTFFQSGTFSTTDPRPISADSKFEIGSITKVFTSLLLAESERAHKVSRLDPAAKYLLPTDDPDNAALAKITLLSLATHTSGLLRLPSNFGNPGTADSYAGYDRTKLVAALRTDGARAPVGLGVAYSNFGAAVLGEALGEAWHSTYADALRTHVLTPLGLRGTTLGMTHTAAPADLAPGHADGKLVANWTFDAFAAAGALRSSARDMAHFLSAYLEPKTSPLADAIEATLQPQYPATDVGGRIALGWFITDEGVVWHNGATAGSHAFIGFNRQTGTGVVILANFQRGSEALGFELLGAKPPAPKAEIVAHAEDYVGRYPLSSTFAIEITASDGVLQLQATGQPSLGLHATGQDQFAVVGVPAAISFERDSAGKVTGLILHQNGRDQRGARGELPPPPKEIAVPAATLRDYAGTYPLMPGFVLTVSERNGSLFVQATGQPEAQVYASAPDEFFYKVVDAQISFQRDATGKVTGLVLHQTGHEMPAPKSTPSQ